MSFDRYVFSFFADELHLVRPIEALSGTVIDAEYNARRLAADLARPVVMTRRPCRRRPGEETQTVIVGTYYPDGTRRPYGTSVRQRYDRTGRRWIPVKEGGEA